MSNVIFLDVDGVLNSKFWDNEHQREISNGKYIDSEAVKLLGSLVKRTNAMKKVGITIAGVTPDLTTEEIRKTKKFSLVKADEILLWLKENPSDNWVVLDDLELHNSEITKHQVKTDAEVGLTTKDVEKATAILLSNIR